MNLKEIVFRGNGSDITTEEQIYVVKEFIKEKKGKEIDIYIRTSLHRGLIEFDPLLKRDLRLLSIAYFKAESYFIKNL